MVYQERFLKAYLVWLKGVTTYNGVQSIIHVQNYSFLLVSNTKSLFSCYFNPQSNYNWFEIFLENWFSIGFIFITDNFWLFIPFITFKLLQYLVKHNIKWCEIRVFAIVIDFISVITAIHQGKGNWKKNISF